MSELTCREFVELVTDYLEDALSPVDRQRFEEHLAVCQGCEAYLEQMRLTLDAAGQLREDAVPQADMQKLLDVFQAWKGRSAE